MELLGLIKNFRSYQVPQLEQMKKDLNLKMPVQALQFASSYYRTKAKRDPQIDELMLWDHFFAQMSSDASAIAPTELLTNDAFVAQTYADLMKKRELCHQSIKAPCGFGEALQTITEYLDRIGKHTDPTASLPLLEDRTAFSLSNAEENTLLPLGSDFRIRVLSHQTKKQETDDCIVMLTQGEKQSAGDYHCALGAFLNASAVTDQITSLKTVDRCGLIKAVLSISAGAWINLSCLSKTGESVPLSLLTDGYEGTYIARVPKESLKDLYRFASLKGVHVLYFADVLAQPMLKITRVNKETFFVDASFVRALPLLRPVSAHLASEDPTSPLCITHSAGALIDNPYLSFPATAPKTQAIPIKDLLVANASSKTSNNFFLNALYTTLVPVCVLALCGCDYSKQALSIGINLPTEAYRDPLVGEACATILGIYRAQAELALTAHSNQLIAKGNAEHPQATVFASAPKQSPLPNSLQTVGNRIYLVSVPTDENGLPVFIALRKLLNEITVWAKAKKLQSGSVILGQSPTDALAQMSKNGLMCHITDQKIAGEGPLSLAFLIESQEELPLCEIGTVQSNEHPSEEEETIQIVRKTSLIPSEKTMITVLAKGEDTAAQALASLLNRHGAEVTLLLSDQTETSTLARSILNADVLMLCKETSLSDDREIRFALTVMKKMGGVCIAFEKDAKDADVCLANGLTETNLEEICNKIKKD